MYNDGDRAFGTATELCLHERMQIALEGMIVARYTHIPRCIVVVYDSSPLVSMHFPQLDRYSAFEGIRCA